MPAAATVPGTAAPAPAESAAPTKSPPGGASEEGSSSDREEFALAVAVLLPGVASQSGEPPPSSSVEVVRTEQAPAMPDGVVSTQVMYRGASNSLRETPTMQCWRVFFAKNNFPGVPENKREYLCQFYTAKAPQTLEKKTRAFESAISCVDGFVEPGKPLEMLNGFS